MIEKSLHSFDYLKLSSILIKTTTIFKTPNFGYGVMFSIINNFNKKLVNGVTVNANVFSDVVV